MFRYTLFLAVPLFGVASVILSQQAAKSDDPVAPAVKTDKCLVYCIPGTLVTQTARPPDDEWSEQYTSSLLSPGLTLLHISVEGRQARVLRTTGRVLASSRDKTAAARVHTGEADTRCIGLMASGDHLYVAVWEAVTSPPEPGGGRSDVQTCILEVFSLESGQKVGQAVLNGKRRDPRGAGPAAALPAKPPEETALQGALSADGSGVKLFGATFTVDQGKLKWSDAAPATTPATQGSGTPGTIKPARRE